MVQITARVDGMMCENCEAHVNSAIKKAFKIKAVASSHSKGETVIIAKENPGEDRVKEVIESTGYKVISLETAPCEKKGLFTRKNK